MSAPDQPAGMNELRGIFNAYAISLHEYSNGRGKPDDYTVQTAKAVASVQQIVERCIGQDDPDIPMEPVRPDGSQMMQINPGKRVRAEIRHNFQQAGMLRGDET